ncbi:hypothetical protein BDZ90DRAFT_173381 [Jaminaea rosea]|uniref:Uncharacterized protein n=1 Tax=Jaminaea rosea TaxID=1569628 RepID=A0A316UU40_9BASI|nr:hypothetical protein BDZ90DRAFT_173381 [Jaminaea rosea]PWN27841.1 hypothetical protein BDZ90DRAFT_173381 [Jaminaea rosea]
MMSAEDMLAQRLRARTQPRSRCSSQRVASDKPHSEPPSPHSPKQTADAHDCRLAGAEPSVCRGIEVRPTEHTAAARRVLALSAIRKYQTLVIIVVSSFVMIGITVS